MDNQIQLFTNELFGNVRSIVDGNGNPWFVGIDVAKCLGYSDTDQAIRHNVDEEDKTIINLNNTPYGLRGNPNKVIINESGLYSLIFGSKLPAAKEFKHWVTSVVLPSMRRIGFTRSMQLLDEEVYKLRDMVEEVYQQSNLISNIDRVENAELRTQIIDKIYSLPNGTPITEEVKQFLVQYDPNWEE